MMIYGGVREEMAISMGAVIQDDADCGDVAGQLEIVVTCKPCSFQM